MKEITKRGNLTKKKTICPECGCEFSFEITDIDTSTFACYISCPECEYAIKDFNRTRKDFFNTFEDYNENHDETDYCPNINFMSCHFEPSKCSVSADSIQLNTQSFSDTESSIITLDNYFDEMRKANTYSHEVDEEQGHKWADNILCSLLRSLGYNDLVDIYDDVAKWYC